MKPTTYGVDDAVVRMLVEGHKRRLRVAPLIQAIKRATDWKERLRAISAYYEDLTPSILATAHDRWANDVYEVDWMMMFTPIEYGLWCDIRYTGIVMYPQYPVTVPGEFRPITYYADFANPVRKVAFECDGKQFHQDVERDRRRDAAMAAQGWRVFRFNTEDCRSDETSKVVSRIARQYLDDVEQGQAVIVRKGGFE